MCCCTTCNIVYCRVVCDRCVECLIEEQKKKWLNRLDEIRAIDTATQATVYRLSLIRANEQSPRVGTLLLLYLILLSYMIVGVR